MPAPSGASAADSVAGVSTPRPPRGSAEPADGLLLVDKPAGWTSHDVVARTRRLAGTRKVGHAGTLDPMATGLLVLGINRATRLLTYLVGADKTYTATVRLGQATTTDDAQGETTSLPGAPALTGAQLEAALDALRGEIRQVPSSVSAIKVDGRRAYARVRDGEEVELAARPVTVSRFEVLARRGAQVEATPVVDVDVTVTCSSGTYVRALARDLGSALGCGGHLTALRRHRVGPFDLADATDLERLDAQAGQPVALLDLATAADRAFPVRRLSEAEARALSYGQGVATDEPAGTAHRPVAGVAPTGELVALLADRDGRARPVLVLRPA